MKLNKLFILMLALPLAMVACNKTTEPKPAPEAEYSVDVEMTSAQRIRVIPEANVTLPDHQYMILLQDAKTDSMLTLFVMGEDGETALTAGTYNSSRGALVLDACAYMANETEYTFTEGSMTVEFSSATSEYNIDVKFADANGDKYHFTYNGEIAGMIDDTIVMAEAHRADTSQMGLPANYFAIMFLNTSHGQLGIVLVGKENETVLSAGTYTIENGGVFADGCEYMYGANDSYYFGNGSVEVVVGGDIFNYTFDITATDDQGNSFHFYYEGKVADMDPAGEPYAFLYGFNRGLTENGVYEYLLYISDTNMPEDNSIAPYSEGYVINIFCSEEAVIDADNWVNIPLGTYTCDLTGTHAAGTFCGERDCSYHVKHDGENALGTFLSEGVVNITADGIEIDAVFGGNRHHVRYSGEPRFQDRTIAK